MEWISVKENPPPSNIWVLCFNGSVHIKFYEPCLFYDGDHHFNRPLGMIDEVTHWMPLPSPPKDLDGMD